jgi:hypothetical protein
VIRDLLVQQSPAHLNPVCKSFRCVNVLTGATGPRWVKVAFAKDVALCLSVLVLASISAGCHSDSSGKTPSESNSSARNPQPKPVDIALIGAPSANLEELSANPASSKPPARGFVWVDGNSDKIGYRAGIGSYAPGEVFDFDAKKQTTALHGKEFMQRPSNDSPVPAEMEMSGVNSILTDSGGTLRLYGSYRNLIFDFSGLKKPMQSFFLGTEASPKGDTLSVIQANVDGVREIFVSPTDLVYPEQTRTVQNDGPFAQLSFSLGKIDEGNLIPPQSFLVVSRNGAEVTRIALPTTGDPVIELKRVARSNDVVSWHIEDRSGMTLGSSSFGLPIRGAALGLVKYVVRVDEHLSRPKK